MTKKYLPRPGSLACDRRRCVVSVSYCLQKLDQCPSFLSTKLASDDPVRMRPIIEFVAGIAVASQSCIQPEAPRELPRLRIALVAEAAQIKIVFRGHRWGNLVAHADRIVLAPSQIEALRPLRHW